MMREETDEEIVREAIGVAEEEGYTELYEDASAALDRLVAERDKIIEGRDIDRRILEGLREDALARAEAAEKAKEELHKSYDEMCREAAEAWMQFTAAEARAEAAERRLRDAPLGGDGSHWDGCWRSHIDCAVARAEAAEKGLQHVRDVIAAYPHSDDDAYIAAEVESALRLLQAERDEALEFAAEMEKEADTWKRSRNAVLDREQVTRARCATLEKERDEWMASFNTATARVNAEQARCATLEAALAEIVGMPTTERNPDGEEQAAHSIKVVAADALAAASQPAEET